MTAGSTIDYEGLAQEAMRGVVRSVLISAAKSGLPGDHHFYISFETEAPGVSLSKRLREKYPREMTIVLQHRFWDLAVTEERFEVKLTFDGIPERLVVPFAAVKVFFDPSVRFGLQFDDPNADPDDAQGPAGFDAMTTRGVGGRAQSTRKTTRSARKPRSIGQDADSSSPTPGVSGPVIAGPGASAGTGATGPVAVPDHSVTTLKPVSAQASEGVIERDTASVPSAPVELEAAKPAGGAEIVSLDKFRKK